LEAECGVAVPAVDGEFAAVAGGDAFAAEVCGVGEGGCLGEAGCGEAGRSDAEDGEGREETHGF